MLTVAHLLKDKGNKIFSVAPTDTVLHAVEVMATAHVGALLVMEQGVLKGVISERDYARKVILMHRASHDTPVADIMTSPAVTVTPDRSVHECMQIMTERRFRHLPVCDDDRVVAMISIGDLVKWIIDGQDRAIHQLEDYISGKYPG